MYIIHWLTHIGTHTYVHRWQGKNLKAQKENPKINCEKEMWASEWVSVWMEVVEGEPPKTCMTLSSCRRQYICVNVGTYPTTFTLAFMGSYTYHPSSLVRQSEWTSESRTNGIGGSIRRLQDLYAYNQYQVIENHVCESWLWAWVHEYASSVLLCVCKNIWGAIRFLEIK